MENKSKKPRGRLIIKRYEGGISREEMLFKLVKAYLEESLNIRGEEHGNRQQPQ